jgi:L-ascorbate metabolism protein UlaG (beta-lactamase superfamily)
MPSVTRTQVVGISVVLIVIIAVSGYVLVTNIPSPPDEPEILTIHLLETECLILEYNDMRIFVDPWILTENYTGLLADAVLITHPHFDHYNETTMNSLQKESTVNVLPANMSDELTLHDATGVNPGDVVTIGSITVTAFPMYTNNIGHPREANWTSYLININGFTVFHGGDATNISEYEQLNGLVDLACLPIYAYDTTIVSAIEMIQPQYFLPMHFDEGYDEIYLNVYGDAIVAVSDCEIIRMGYGTMYTFEI